MKCPVDNTALTIAERSGVEIDYCPECRGVWLDRGELDKIIDRNDRTPDVPPQPRYEERPDKHGGYGDSKHGYDPRYAKRKKREGFLGDLFDF